MYTSLLSDYTFSELPDTCKAHVMGLFLLAAQCENRIPYDPKWIAAQINAKAHIDFTRIFASNMLAIRKQDAITRQRRDRDKEETETETEAGGVEKNGESDALFTARIWPHYPRKVARKPGLKCFSALLKAKVPVADLEAATRNYALAVTGKEAQHVLHAATFFGPQDRWRDFVDGVPEGEQAKPKDRNTSLDFTDAEYDNLPEGMQ